MADTTPASIFLQSIRRDLNCLSDPDRTTRWKALEKLSKRFSLRDDLPSADVLQEVWDDTICPHMLRVFHDHTEKCRSIAISLTISILNYLGDVERAMALAIPIMVERIGKLPVAEPSEEIRLSLMKLLKCLISCCSLNTLMMNLESISQILSILSADPFHEIKKEICDIISLIVSRTENIPLPISEKLFKAILPNITHPHSKIRIAILQGINAIMRCCFQFDAIVDLLVPSIQALAFDRIEKVRKLFYESIAEWLRDGLQNSVFSNNIKKRIPQLLPLLLLGIFDASEEIGMATLLLVEDVGIRYEHTLLPSSCTEEDDTNKCKDRSDHSLCYCTRGIPDNLVMVNGVEDIPVDDNSMFGKFTRDTPDDSVDQYLKLLPAPFQRIPGTGCRKMVQDFVEELLSPITKQLQEWTEAARCGAARLLHAVLIMAEGFANPLLDAIIPTMCSAVGDDNVSVAQSIVGASHVLGWHVPPDRWLPLVLHRVVHPGATPVQVANGLVVTSGLLHGTQKNAISENVVIQRDHPECRVMIWISIGDNAAQSHDFGLAIGGTARQFHYVFNCRRDNP